MSLSPDEKRRMRSAARLYAVQALFQTAPGESRVNRQSVCPSQPSRLRLAPIGTRERYNNTVPLALPEVIRLGIAADRALEWTGIRGGCQDNHPAAFVSAGLRSGG